MFVDDCDAACWRSSAACDGRGRKHLRLSHACACERLVGSLCFAWWDGSKDGPGPWRSDTREPGAPHFGSCPCDSEAQRSACTPSSGTCRGTRHPESPRVVASSTSSSTSAAWTNAAWYRGERFHVHAETNDGTNGDCCVDGYSAGSIGACCCAACHVVCCSVGDCCGACSIAACSIVAWKYDGDCCGGDASSFDASDACCCAATCACCCDEAYDCVDAWNCASSSASVQSTCCEASYVASLAASRSCFGSCVASFDARRPSRRPAFPSRKHVALAGSSALHDAGLRCCRPCRFLRYASADSSCADWSPRSDATRQDSAPCHANGHTPALFSCRCACRPGTSVSTERRISPSRPAEAGRGRRPGSSIRKVDRLSKQRQAGFEFCDYREGILRGIHANSLWGV